MKRSLRLLTLASVAALAFGAADHAQAAHPRRQDGLCPQRGFAVLDPVLLERNVDIWVLTNLYDTLLEPSGDGKSIEPGLATGYEVSDDGLSFT